MDVTVTPPRPFVVYPLPSSSVALFTDGPAVQLINFASSGYCYLLDTLLRAANYALKAEKRGHCLRDAGREASNAKLETRKAVTAFFLLCKPNAKRCIGHLTGQC